MGLKGDKIDTKKKRVYQVAKEFHVSNEALIEFLQKHDFKPRNHMAPVTAEMYAIVQDHYAVEEADTRKEPDYRRRIMEKKEEAEARKEAIRHEIDEILERSKTAEFEPVKVVERKPPKKKAPKKTKKAEPVSEEVVQEEVEVAAETKKKEKAKPEVKEEKLRILGKIDTELETEPKKRGKKKKDKEADEADKGEKTAEEERKPKRHLKKRSKVEKDKAGEEEGDGKGKRVRKKRKKGGTDESSIEELIAPAKKKKKRKRKKAAVQIDEKEIEASIKETLAKMSDTGKRRRKKERQEEEVVMEDESLIKTTEFISVGELATLMDVDSSEVIQACISLGLMVTINQRLDKDTILMVADEFDYDVKFLTEYGEERLETLESEEEEDESLLENRPPVVTIMGHVDHGKTSLLDYIRESNIIAGESGGITQHIGAYEVEFKEKMITFLDTPGHAAFTAMRARGAQVTDIVVLVVAADDSVMPQTIEAINHAKAAGVPIIVALNKMDKPNANPDQIKQQLADHNVLVEDWGGKVQCAELSAKTGEGVDHLLEIILLEAEVLELKANPKAKAKAVLVEARIDKGRGVIGTVLVQRGTLRIGDPFVAGQFHGRVRAMFDERDHAVSEAPPSTPVLLLGFTGVPQAGDILTVVASEQEAREIGTKRQQLKREQSFRQIRRLTLDQISQRIAEGEIKELSIIVKADVDGSLEAISDSLMNLGTEDVGVQIIHRGVGTITEYDVLLASASQAVIIGFHVGANAQATEDAKKEMVDIRFYEVIYDIVNDVKLALSGLLEPEIHKELVGTVEIRDLFKASKIGNIAGCYVQSGKILRSHIVHLVRDGETVYEGKISTLKRFKEDVKEVAAGYECGITLDGFDDIRVGDVIETYITVETERTLE